MTNLDQKWWERVATMDRKELLDALVLSEEALLDTQDTLEALNKAVYLRHSVVVAYSRAEAELSLKRLGLSWAGRDGIYTIDRFGQDKLIGRKLENGHVLLIPGWGRGDFAAEIREMLRTCGATWQNCLVAPSPETDRAEGLSNWGRTEAETVDDMLSTVNGLLDRTLKRTEGKHDVNDPPVSTFDKQYVFPR